MEKALVVKDMSGLIIPALVMGALAFALIVVAFGAESVLPGVHDAFHDLRHTLGMPCH